ncbi:MAG: glycoside hydrolase family 57 protein [Myxococcota bacterium]
MTDQIRLQFLWHFHQPYYSVPDAPANKLPWVRMHAIRSYYDMGRLLERYPEIRCAINFSGSLLEQLREYIEEGKRDTWWDLTQKRSARLTDAEKHHILRHFFSLDWETAIEPMPRYWELLQKRGKDPAEIVLTDFTNQDLRDVQVLFNLAWFGFTAREERVIVQALLDKGEGFTESEKEALLEQQIEVMQLLPPMYRRLHRRGQIELSVTPMYHPILPLLIDTESARRASPERPMPPRFEASEDARHQVQTVRHLTRDFLGIDVDGMWPAEGSVSPEAMQVFADEGVRWVATDEGILEHSRSEYDAAADKFRPWHLAGCPETAIFFRDREASDKISFTYAHNDAEAAVDDFMDTIRGRASDARAAGVGDELVYSVILDGENPWGTYPGHGEAFLNTLYERIGAADDIITVTPGDYLEDGYETRELTEIHSGSWIESSYDIWIGHEDTNRAWELLARARGDLIEECGEPPAEEDSSAELAWEAIYMAEGSDWFWWFGDDFSSENDADFDRLFRSQLRFAYTSVGLEPPGELDIPISKNEGQRSHFEPPHSLVKPTIDGRSDYFYEWSGSGVYVNRGAPGSTFESHRYIEEMRVGFDLETLSMRLDPGEDFLDVREDLVVRVKISGPSEVDTVVVSLENGLSAEIVDRDGNTLDIVELAAFDDYVEISVPFKSLDLSAGDDFELIVSVWKAGLELERHPPNRPIELTVPDETFEMQNWMV